MRLNPIVLVLNMALATLSGAQAADEEAGLAEVIVTGTRIISPNLTSSSPVQVVSEEEFKLQGTTDAVNLLNGLPQVFQNNAADFSNTSNPLLGPGGVTTVDLRGLGPQRTLVLVNGRRLGVGDAYTGNSNPAPNIDQIPAQLVQRVDIVTGGASAVYGSDAIAGVVNFIMRENFEGVEFDAQYGFNMHHNHNDLMQGLQEDAGFPSPDSNVIDGRSPAFSLIFGANGFEGRANVTGFLTYREAPNVSQSQRDFSACKLEVYDNVPICGGSPNSNEFIVASDQSLDYSVVGNTFVPWGSAASNAATPPALFNSNPFQSLSRDDKRFTAGFMSHYDLSDAASVYADFNYMNDKSFASTAPSALFLGQNPFSPTGSGAQLVNCDNPFLSAQQRSAIGCTDADVASTTPVFKDIYIGRRNIEGGPRINSYEHENYRLVTGVKGKVWDGWSYDAYGSYYYSTVFSANDHYISWQAANNALQVRSVAGVPTCISKIDGSDTACVPYNIFADGGVTPEALAYLTSYGVQYGTVTEKILSGTLAGDLGRYGLTLPTAQDGVSIAGGVEYRSDAVKFTPDRASLSGDLAGFGGELVAIDNSINVREIYGELRVPLVQQRPGIQELALDAGYRYSDYSTAGGVGTYKGGLQYAPRQDIRFRGSYQRAIRAPNIIELYNPPSVTNTSEVSTDPCAGATPTATLTECARTGVTPAQYGNIIQCPSGQCAVLNGGNVALEPEVADTYSIGFTLTPAFLPAFTASIDYYRIKIEDKIDKVPLGSSLDGCLETGSPVLCANVKRTVTGNLFGATASGGGYIDGRPLNIAEMIASGVDVQAAYALPLPEQLGAVTLAMSGSYLDKLQTTPFAGDASYDCAGLYGAKCQTVNPQWRHSLRATWKTPWLNQLLISAQWRYIGKVTLETNTTQTQLTDGQIDTFQGTLAGINYFDLSAIWNVTDKIAVRAGFNNLFDKDPPLVSSLIAGTGTPNTYPTYDLLGRQVFIGLNAKLF